MGRSLQAVVKYRKIDAAYAHAVYETFIGYEVTTCAMCCSVGDAEASSRYRGPGGRTGHCRPATGERSLHSLGHVFQ